MQSLRHAGARRRLVLRPLALAALAALTACGGGGGSSGAPVSPNPPAAPVLTAANHEAVAKDSYRALGFAMDMGDMASSGGGGLRAAGPQRRSLGALQRPLAEHSETLSCPDGGTLKVVLNDVNNNQRVDAGDGIRMEAQACRSQDETAQGGISLTVAELQGTPGRVGYLMRMDLQSQAFTISRSNGDRSTADGRLGMVLSEPATGLEQITLSSSRFELNGLLAGQNFREALIDLQVQARTETLLRPARTQLSLRGSYESSRLGTERLRFETGPDFVRTSDQAYPASGQLLLRDARGAQLRLVALNAQQVRVEFDANGDGAFELSQTRNWRDFGG